MKHHLLFLALALALIGATSARAAESVEVLHRWTTPGEAHAVSVLKSELSAWGITWVDMAVPGGDVDGTMAVLRKRVTTRDPPTAAHMFHADALQWERLGAMADLGEVAAREGWDRLVPKAVQDRTKVNGKWVAVPVDINLYNLLWASKPVLDSVGVRALPDSWDAFIAIMDKVRAKGLIGLAMSGKAWETGVVFEAVTVATGGAEFHRRAFRDLDRAALDSDTMRRVFDRMSQLREYTDPDYAKRDWSAASALLIHDKAAFQIQGAWAKGEFSHAGKVAGRDFLCGMAPGTRGVAIFSPDLLGMFNLGSGGFRLHGAQEAQYRMASVLMSVHTQVAFNVAKGSIPARLDVPEEAFDTCGQQMLRDVKSAEREGSLMDAMTRQVTPAQRSAFLEIIDHQFNGRMTSAEAASAMAAVLD